MELLINLFSAKTLLYNCREPDYHNKVTRAAAVAEIAEALGTTGKFDQKGHSIYFLHRLLLYTEKVCRSCKITEFGVGLIKD